jgi:hypothetical protein
MWTFDMHSEATGTLATVNALENEELASAAPLEPLYPSGPPGAPVELYSGPMTVGDSDPFPGRIYADLAGDLQVR